MWLEHLRSAWPGPCGQVWLSRLGLLEPVGSVTRILVLGMGVSTGFQEGFRGPEDTVRSTVSPRALCASALPLKCHHSDAQQALL